MLFQHEFSSLRLLPFHPLSLPPSLPLLSLFLSTYIDIQERSSPLSSSPVHFMRPPAKENISRLSSQLLLSRIFPRRVTRENGRERGSYHSDCRVDVLKIQSSAHVENVSNAPTEEYVRYCVCRLSEVSIGRTICSRCICFRITCV